MNNPESAYIIKRFYEALDMLIANGTLAGVQTFTKEYNINRWNLQTVRANPESDMFQLIWISHLVSDFGVSAEWIMTGRGGMFNKRNITFINRENKTMTLEELKKFDNKKCLVTHLPAQRKAYYTGIVSVLFNSKTERITLKVKTDSKLTKTIKAEDIIDIKLAV